MSTGISISSINQIKELAEQKRYAEALEILDTQNLDKSINPQFLRISGEIFRENKRYYDSRRILLKAHQMAPQGTRIIAELIRLYLELGYFSLAEKYYEQYKFYVSPEDTQKDFVEYIMKKATNTEIKELASILIPILERMPEDMWNFEAVLLYHKMDRKDKALDESRYILENFKDSIYSEKVIAYINDKLDVDAEFFIFPKEEKEDDVETFGDLIEQEQSILAQDYLRMYPPEPRIMVEADDLDALDAKPVKEKKPKEKKVKEKKNKDKLSVIDKLKKNKSTDDSDGQELIQDESAQSEDVKNTSDDAKVLEDDKVEAVKDSDTVDSKESSSVDDSNQSEVTVKATAQGEDSSKDIVSSEDVATSDTSEATEESATEEEVLDEETRIKQEREAALEKLLAKHFDTDKMRESAKQVAEAVKNIDTSKAKEQVKMVTDVVTDNVKKASEVIGDAVGVSEVMNNLDVIQDVPKEDFVDGIIESVLEPPKQTVGQVVMNEELDALIPDSLEAMSEDEIADIEARKEEQERMELEALEASLKLEEEKKSKRKKAFLGDTQENASDSDVESSEDAELKDDSEDSSLGHSYAALKQKYIESFVEEEELPMDSLGFISVVHSDVDRSMEDDIPDTAQMLRQMIGNKEFYSDENSLGFESEESYRNHGFEIEDYEEDSSLNAQSGFVYVKEESNSDVYRVESIFVDETIETFDDMVPQVDNPFEKDFETLSQDGIGDFLMGKKVQEEETSEISVNDEVSTNQDMIEDEPVREETQIDNDTIENDIFEDVEYIDITSEEMEVSSELAPSVEELSDEVVSEDVQSAVQVVDSFESESLADNTSFLEKVDSDDLSDEEIHSEEVEESEEIPYRMKLRIRIQITDNMTEKLLALKDMK